jgi:hypothetical protein
MIVAVVPVCDREGLLVQAPVDCRFGGFRAIVRDETVSLQGVHL